MKRLRNLAEQALDDSTQIYLAGAGTWTVGHLKKSADGKLEDLKRRLQSGELQGVGPAQLETLCHMLLTLRAAEEGNPQGPDRTRLQVDEPRTSASAPAAPSNVVPIRK